MRPADLSLLRELGAPAVHPDGHAVVAVRRMDLDKDEYRSELWRVEPPGGAAPAAITQGAADSQPVYSPDGAVLAFVRKAGDAKPQLFAMRGGAPVQLTDAPLGVSQPAFSPDGARLAYLARVPSEGRFVEDVPPAKEPPRLITTQQWRMNGLGYTADQRQHLFVIDVPDLGDPEAARPTPNQLTEGDYDVSSPSWLPDSSGLLAVAALDPALDRVLAQDVVRIGLDGGPTALTDSTLAVDSVVAGDDGLAWFLAGEIGASGIDFVARNNALMSMPAGGGPRTTHTDPATTDLVGGPGLFRRATDGVAVGVRERGSTRVARFSDGELTMVTQAGLVVAGSADGPDGLVFAAASPDSPGEVYWASASSADATRATDFATRLRAAGIAHGDERVATGRDGYPIHGWVFTPDGDGPHPVLLQIHGGPYAEYTPAFFDETQIYVAAGYAVVMCNPRGAASYGEAHGRAIKDGFGTVDAADVLDFLDAALADPRLDAARVGVMGGSYGGYLTAWLTTQTDRFKAAIVERGFLDPVSFVGSSDIGWFFGTEYLGEDPVRVAAQSPMAHIGKVTTPTLVIHSEDDLRCPIEQGQRWYTELLRQGVPTALLVFPGENHELSRSGTPRHRQARFEHILAWWSERL